MVAIGCCRAWRFLVTRGVQFVSLVVDKPMLYSQRECDP
jgi:hypothetical protein